MDTIDARPSGRHPVNIGHLVMGLAFLGIVGIWALVQTDAVSGDDIRWLMPIPWVVAGAVGLTVTAVTGSQRYAVRQVGWAGDRPDQPAAPEPAEEPEEPLPATVEETTPATVEETAPITAESDPESHPDHDQEEKS